MKSAGQLANFLKYNIHKPDWGIHAARLFEISGPTGDIIVAIPSLLFGEIVTCFGSTSAYATVFYSGVLCFFLGVRHYFFNQTTW